jgi:hypothetical protein
MGAGNVALVFARWGQLNHAPFRALTYMAHRSLDNDNPPRFWGGREEIAFALGRVVPEGLDDSSIRQRKAALEAVKDVMKALKAAGAVTQVQASKPGQRAVYVLNLRSRMVGAETPPVVGAQPPLMVGAEPAIGGGSTPPRGVEEELGLSSGVAGQDHPEPAGTARTSEANNRIGSKIGEFNYQSASAYLMLLDEESRVAVDTQARQELPDADREKQIIRAAEIALTAPADEHGQATR